MIGEIEAAMIAAVKAASAAGYFGAAKLKSVESMSGKSFDKANTLSAVNGSPCAFVAFLSAQPTDNDYGTSVETEARYTVIVCDRHLGGVGQARQGTAATPGAYPMAEAVLRLLHGQELDLDIQPLQADGITPLFNDMVDDQRGAFVAVDFITRYVMKLPTDAEIATMADFVTFHADWDIEPHIATPTDPLPLPAGQADATDTVILETQP